MTSADSFVQIFNIDDVTFYDLGVFLYVDFKINTHGNLSFRFPQICMAPKKIVSPRIQN